MSDPNKAVEIELDHFHHQPFQLLTGRVRVSGAVTAKKIELRIFWFTQGRGDEEVGLLHQLEITPHEGSSDFSWKLPASPYSFAGQLITLAWAVEVVDENDQSLDLVPFLLSPTGEEIQLEEIPDTSAKGRLKQKLQKQFAPAKKR